MAKTETGRSIVPDIVNAGDDESIRSPRNNVGIGKLPSGGTIFTSTYVHSNEDDLEGAEEEVYNDRISGNGKDINPSDVGVPKPIERCQQRLATFDKEKCRENVRVCEKVCKEKGRSCYNALPSPPQCPKLACSVDMMSKLPNWLLFFFIHNEPKDINFKDFVKKDEASFHLKDFIRSKTQQTLETVGQLNRKLKACSKTQDPDDQTLVKRPQVLVPREFMTAPREGDLSNGKDKHEFSRQNSYRQKDAKIFAMGKDGPRHSHGQLDNTVQPFSKEKLRRSHLKRRKQRGAQKHVWQGKPIQKDRFGVLTELFDEDKERSKGSTRSFFYTTDNKRYFKQRNLLERHFATRIHTLKSSLDPLPKKTPEKAKKLNENRIFKKNENLMTPPRSHDLFGDISHLSIMKLRHSLNMLEDVSPGKVSRYAINRLGCAKEAVVDTESEDEMPEELEGIPVAEPEEDVFVPEEPKEWVCPSCEYINVKRDEKCVICDTPALLSTPPLQLDEEAAAQLDLRTNMAKMPLDLFVQTLQEIESLVGKAFKFEDLHEFVDLMGNGRKDAPVYTCLTFFGFGLVTTLEASDDIAEEMLRKWNDVKQKLKISKRSFQKELKRIYEVSKIDNAYADEDEEMEMSKEDIEKKRLKEKKKKALARKQVIRETDLTVKTYPWKEYDITTTDVAMLNLTGLVEDADVPEGETVSLKNYIEAMEEWLSYMKGRSFFILFVHENQAEVALNLEIISWKIVTVVQESPTSAREMVMKAVVFRRDFDV